jgi:Transposase DDE domain
LFATLFVVCGKANFTNMSRYSDYSDRTYRRQSDKSFHFTGFNAGTIAEAVPVEREQIAAMDASYVPKSGEKTWGLDWFYNGSAGKSEKGLEISVISVVDVAAHQAYTLSVEQTIARDPADQLNKKSKSSEQTISARVQGYIAQLVKTRPYLPSSVKYLAVDSFYTKTTIIDAVCELELQAVGKLRIDANLQYLYSGPQKGRGAPRKYDGKVVLSNLPRLKFVREIEPEVRMYTQEVWHVSLKRKIRIVVLVNLEKRNKPSMAVLFSTDTELDPDKILTYYKSRFQIEFIFRDAKQFTGLCDCQSRKQARLDFHFNASLTAMNLAKLEMQQSQAIDSSTVLPLSLSMATYRRKVQNNYFLELFISMLDLDQTLIKSHPNYEKLLQHGSMSF